VDQCSNWKPLANTGIATANRERDDVIHGMRDVAQKAGVSKATVSRVLNKAPYVDPGTRQRVLDAASELNYYPNLHARRLARGGSDFFGLLISDIENPVFPELIKSFETAAAEKGFDLLLCTTNYDDERARAAIRKMIENSVRGVAMMTSGIGPELVEELAAHSVSVVSLDLGPARKYISNIQIDYSAGINEAIDHLVNVGHREFGFVAGLGARRSATRYRQAVIQALHEKKLPFPRIVECDQTTDGGDAAVRNLLGLPGFPTAILCINDLTAIGVMRALENARLRVPQDVSVVGCEDIYLSRLVQPSLTTVKVDRKRQGRMAFEVLQQMLRSRRRRGSESILETRLIVRRSTGECCK
jgi:DNA-binding LacI/PurR family transcriptional regulator